MADFVTFIISAAVIVVAGIKLTKYTDILSDKYQLGKAWIGIILLGIVTSLPEAVASLYAIVSLNAPDLAAGNILGSNNFNPLILAFLDLFHRRGSITNEMRLTPGSIKAIQYFYVLSMILALEIILGYYGLILAWGPITIGTVLGFMCYGLGIRQMPASHVSEQAVNKDEFPSLKKIALVLSVSSLFVIIGAMFLSGSADAIAEATGLGRTFVGSLLLALVTSLPEIVVSLSALSLGSLDLAVGNVFGSNMTNMFILNICASFTQAKPFVISISKTHVVTIILSWLMVSIAFKGLKDNKKRAFGPLAWDTWLMWLCFVLGMFLIYQMK